MISLALATFSFMMFCLSSYRAFVAPSKVLQASAHLIVRHASFSDDRKGQWRPSVDDVIRISWGKPAKKKGTGSRGVPHRLNTEEREIFDRGVNKGFIELGGSGWRKQRRDSPLVNTWRSFCDSKRQPFLAVFKDSQGMDDVSLDLSPLRLHLLEEVSAVAAVAGETAAPIVAQHGGHGGINEEFEGQELGTAITDDEDTDGGEVAAEAVGKVAAETSDDAAIAADLASPDDWLQLPIYRLPPQIVSWVIPRQGAKELAKALSKHFGTATAKEPVPRGGPKRNRASSRHRGHEEGFPGRSPREKKAPQITPGKSRRSGGYGIG
jgi:hypothetical protein